MYPSSENYPSGKLRLVYECNPVAFIVEQAGGIASDGHRRILDIVPDALHQRTSYYAGSVDMVNRLEGMLR